MNTTGIGKNSWIIPGGHIPMGSIGHEPEFTSHDKISILNTNLQEAQIQLIIFYEDAEPAGPYTCSVGGQRIRKIRINDLIDPLPVFLDRPYSLLIKADLPVVVQFMRQSTESDRHTITGSLAFAVKK